MNFLDRSKMNYQTIWITLVTLVTTVVGVVVGIVRIIGTAAL